jgi:transposase
MGKSLIYDWGKLLKGLDGLGPQERLRVCYEAGPTGYDLARRLNGTGICCIVVAPSLIPVQAGRRVKTDRRDARRLAELLRAGELVEVKIPETETEAMRDLERARDDAKNAERAARHQLDKFLLRQGRIWSDGTKWTKRHWSWIERQEFAAEAQRRLHRPTAASGENHPHGQRTCATDPGGGGLELPFPSPRVQSDPPTPRAGLGGGAGDFREG